MSSFVSCNATIIDVRSLSLPLFSVHQNATNCEVLVTVPECLEILMLYPERVKWASSVRYMIFDEVHTIGEDEHGAILERLLLMVQCPFLALSATIGEPCSSLQTRVVCSVTPLMPSI